MVAPDRVRVASSTFPRLTAKLTAKPHDNTGPQGMTMDAYTRLSCANGLGGDNPRNLRERESNRPNHAGELRQPAMGLSLTAIWLAEVRRCAPSATHKVRVR